MQKEFENSHKEQLVYLNKAIDLQDNFSLLVGEFNHHNYRDKIIEDINDQFTDNEILDIAKVSPGTKSFFESFEASMASLSRNHSVIHVVNNGERFYRETQPLFYKGLNYRREIIAEKTPVTIIVWMLNEDIRDFARNAPDMWSWRAGIFNFKIPEKFYDNAPVYPLKPFSQKEKIKTEGRIEEILHHLDKNPHLPDAERTELFDELGASYYFLANYKKAEKWIWESLVLHGKKGDLQRIYRSYCLLQCIYWETGENENELLTIEKRISLKKSLEFDIDNSSIKNKEEGNMEKKNKTHKILVVDDEKNWEELLRKKFKEQLGNKEWEFIFTKDGLEALEKVNALEKMNKIPEIDLILLDIKMPRMNGLEFLEKLNALITPGIKTVMITAFRDNINVSKAMRCGAFDFLDKPVDLEELKRIVYKAFERNDVEKEIADARQQQESLDAAVHFQDALLPHNFPSSKNFDIYAQMNRTPRMGGDFYDSLVIGEEKLVFFVGQVFGKGSREPLYMERCSTILKILAEQGEKPGECLRRVNNHFTKLRIEEPQLTVNLFLGMLNIKTGEIQYSWAGGVGLPYIIKNNKKIRKLLEAGERSYPIGYYANVEYDCKKIQLGKGDMICLFTTGVTNAQNSQGIHFEKDKKGLLAYLEKSGKKSSKEFVEGLMAEIDAFITGTTQKDDITVLALKYNER